MNLIVNIATALLFANIAWSQNTVAPVPCPSRCRSCENGVAECSRSSLTAPPKFYPPSIRTVNLEGNHIRVVAERTFGFHNFTEVLKISNNKIVALRNDAFSPFPNLVILDLTDNKISRINRRTFKDLNKLRTLSLNRNKIESLEAFLQYVPNLHQLNMANNRIAAIGQHDLSAIARVHYLDIRDNLVSSIHSQAFKNLLSLRYLFLNNNPLLSTPHFEFGSSVLQLVDFSNCELSKVPGPFPPSVTDLRLGHNKIMQVNNTDFINITNMQLLALNDNELHFLADGALTHLTELREVWLRHNSLVYIPRGIPNNVRKVYMDSNNIQQLEIGLFSNMSRLDYLTVESNEINRIQPNTFSGLRFLTTLNFQGNRIQHLEQNAFADIDSLTTLLLSNNPLVRINAGAFRNLGQLSQLFLSYIVEENFQLEENFLPQMLRLQTLHLINSPGLVNDLMNIINDPAVRVTPLDNLQQLDLSYNTLEWISPRIREVFPNLLSMPLEGNPLKCSRRLKWLRDWMVSSEVSFHNFNEIVCETPLRLKDRTVRSIEDDEWASDDEVTTGDVGVVTSTQEQLGSEDGLALGDTNSNLQTNSAQSGGRQGVGKRSKDDSEKRKGKGKGRKEERKSGKKNKKDKSKKRKGNKKGKVHKEKSVTLVGKIV